MKDELQPCPFCGQPPLWVTLPQGFGPLVRPGNFLLHSFAESDAAPCRLAGMHFAPEDWQTRPGEDVLRHEVSRLRMALESARDKLDGARQWALVEEVAAVINDLDRALGTDNA